MPGPTPNIYLDMYSMEFRKGYDAAVSLNAMRTLDRSISEDGDVNAVFICIHKESLAIIEGLLAENMFCFEIRHPPGIKIKTEETEAWIRIAPAKGRLH